jgi:hypothetical protein
MASIAVYFKPVSILGQQTPYYHEFLIYTDDNGNQYIARGGPSSNQNTSIDDSSSTPAGNGGPAPFGYIFTQVTAYNSMAPDYAPPGTYSYQVLEQGTQAQLAPIWNNIVTFINNINSENYIYDFTGPNSNSVVHSALVSAGVPLPTGDSLDGKFPAPGADISLNLTNSSGEAALLQNISSRAEQDLTTAANQFETAAANGIATAENALHGAVNAITGAYSDLSSYLTGNSVADGVTSASNSNGTETLSLQDKSDIFDSADNLLASNIQNLSGGILDYIFNPSNSDLTEIVTTKTNNGDAVYASDTGVNAFSDTTDIESGATVSVQSFEQLPNADQSFVFGGSGDSLVIDDPSNFTGVVSNFLPGDTIDLTGVIATGATIGADNILTVFDGSDVVGTLSLDPNQKFTGEGFVESSDNDGGTNLTVAAIDPAPAGGVGLDPGGDYVVSSLAENFGYPSISWTAVATSNYAGTSDNWSAYSGSMASVISDAGNGLPAFTNSILAALDAPSTYSSLGVEGPPQFNATSADQLAATKSIRYSFSSPVPSSTSFLLWDPGSYDYYYTDGPNYQKDDDYDVTYVYGPYTFDVSASLNGKAVSTAGFTFSIESPSYSSPGGSYSIDAAAGEITVNNYNPYEFPDAVIVITPNTPIDAIEVSADTLYNDDWGLAVPTAIACFAAGTRILTPRGKVEIEELVSGDLVQSQGAGVTWITWMGRRRVDCRRHPKPHEVWPVRIMPGAFGPGMPHRDLWLSPDHAVFAEGVLIPIRYLINGTTIVQEARDEVTYWHIELAQHDLLMAEGLPCESYLDTGTRSSFSNGGSVLRLHADFSGGAYCKAVWEASACAPLRIEGPAVHRVLTRLRRRARELGFTKRIPNCRSSPGPRVKLTSDLAELIRPAWYLAANQDVAAAGADATTHYTNHGRFEGRRPCPEVDLFRALGLIDPGSFIFTMPDVVTAGVDPVEHFAAIGWTERRIPNPYFDTGWYLDTHDVPAGMNPLLHYLLFGENQGLPPSRHFDPAWYRKRYGIKPTASPLAHYLMHRRTQRVSPHPFFDVVAYRRAHASTMRPGRDPYAHFLAVTQVKTEDEDQATAVAA